MKFKDYSKNRIVMAVKVPFELLSQSVSKKSMRKAALEVFREKYKPVFEGWDLNHPEIFRGLATGSYLVVGPNDGLDEPEYIELHEQYPLVTNLITNSSANWGGGTDTQLAKSKGWPISQNDVQEKLEGDDALNFTKGVELSVKASHVERELKEFLSHFEDPRQVGFSFPQLGPFLNDEFQKKIIPQRRPKIRVVPSDELRNLVTQALLLKNAKEEN